MKQGKEEGSTSKNSEMEKFVKSSLDLKKLAYF